MGLSGMIAQIVLLRELLVSFLGNELVLGILLANWLILEATGSFLIGRGEVRQLPYPHRAVVAARDQPSTVRAESQGGHARLMPVQHGRLGRQIGSIA